MKFKMPSKDYYPGLFKDELFLDWAENQDLPETREQAIERLLRSYVAFDASLSENLDDELQPIFDEAKKVLGES